MDSRLKKITIPELSLVLLIGSQDNGASALAKKHFSPIEIVSNPDFVNVPHAPAPNDLWENFQSLLTQRLQAGLLTVVDATAFSPDNRRILVSLAHKSRVEAVAILSVPNPFSDTAPCGDHKLQPSELGLVGKGLKSVHVLTGAQDVSTLVLERRPLESNCKHLTGPFDIIGDIHGCFEELLELLQALGYQNNGQCTLTPPPGRKAVFVGDLVDRGPAVQAVLQLVMAMVEKGNALCVMGNHEEKLLRALKGRPVKVSSGLAISLEQLKIQSQELVYKTMEFLDNLPTHLVLDQGKLVVAHGGMPSHLQGRESSETRSFALYGDTTGEMDENGLPMRRNWAASYTGEALVVYGHTPVDQPIFLNNTVNIDTGCVFGGHLTAYRYPEGEVVSVKAQKVHFPHE